MTREAVTSKQEEARKVRGSVANIWQAVLGKLAHQLSRIEAGKPVPEKLVKSLKIASDQLRLDYRLDTPAAEDLEPDEVEPPRSEDPLDGLRIVA